MQKASEQTKIMADGSPITVRRAEGQPEFVSLTDIAKRENDDPNAVVQNWMRNRGTIEYLGLWETIYNPNFDSAAYENFRVSAGGNSFTMSPKKWIEATRAIGIESKSGRYGGTFANYDIALEFMSWISPAYKLHFLREYQRLKGDEMQRQFAAQAREVFLLPGHSVTPLITALPKPVIWDGRYEALNEDDIVNVALFGITQQEFEKKYPSAAGMVHNNSSISHIIVHQTLRMKNKELITAGLTIQERLAALNAIAIEQVDSLNQSNRQSTAEIVEAKS
jgi:hypothetical protein